MRGLIRVIIFIAVIWSVYWFVAGFGLRNAITTWFDKQQEQGWQADFSDVETAGYPLNHMTRLNNPALADPVNGTRALNVLGGKSQYLVCHHASRPSPKSGPRQPPAYGR